MSTSNHSHIVSIIKTFGEFQYEQKKVLKFFTKFIPSPHMTYAERILNSISVQGRSFALALENFKNLNNLEEKSVKWEKHAPLLAQESLTKLFHHLHINPTEINLLVTASSFPLSSVNLDNLVMNRLPFSPHLKHWHLAGLGDAGGLRALNFLHQYLRLHPEEAAVAVVVEMGSLSLSLKGIGGELSDPYTHAHMTNLALLSDGAVAILMVGDKHPLRRVSAWSLNEYSSQLIPQSESILFWKTTESDTFPCNEKNFGALLEQIDKRWTKLDLFALGTGSAKKIKALEKIFSLDEELNISTWNYLQNYGHMGAVGVLHLMQEIMEKRVPRGTHLLAVDLSPGINVETLLLEKK